MFRRPALPLVVLLVTSVAVSTLSACSDKRSAPAPSPRPFELTAPRGYREVTAPPGLVGAWETAPLANGFQSTINVARRPRPAGTPDEIYVTWRDELFGVLSKQYQEVKVLGERPLEAGPLTGKLIILVVTLPIPGGADAAPAAAAQATPTATKTPMPLFTYAAMFVVGDRLWVLGALTGAALDAQTGTITPLGEPEILSALGSFRVR